MARIEYRRTDREKISIIQWIMLVIVESLILTFGGFVTITMYDCIKDSEGVALWVGYFLVSLLLLVFLFLAFLALAAILAKD